MGILKYVTALSTDKFIVSAHGTAEEASRAREIISRTNPESVVEHRFSAAQAVPVSTVA